MSKTIPAALLLFFCLISQPTSTGGQGTIQPSDSARNRQVIQHDLMIEFATAKRDLAKNELERKVTNADAYPKFFIDRLRAELNVAEKHLSPILVATSDGETALRRRHATEQLRLAKRKLESGKKLRRLNSNFSDLDLQSSELKNRSPN